ncbi:MAG: metal-sensing transcriptional repressor [Moraxellaceae bacterium]|nr:metal-sensing transcriptional repressor [Moraxellaceae bacterium]MBP9045441.1 metal-sensing transcriptional repressor [Moraxellaceae bacterium]MBP9730467.1 metal-sensing transcriptional repressor [Moraxellaceae bacterium]
MLKRLARVEGQVRGVQKLIDQDEDCEKIIQQMTAARKALDKAFHEMLACVIEANVCADEGPVLVERMAQVRALMSKYA